MIPKVNPSASNSGKQGLGIFNYPVGGTYQGDITDVGRDHPARSGNAEQLDVESQMDTDAPPNLESRVAFPDLVQSPDVRSKVPPPGFVFNKPAIVLGTIPPIPPLELSQRKVLCK